MVLKRIAVLSCLVAWLGACSTHPTGRVVAVSTESADGAVIQGSADSIPGSMRVKPLPAVAQQALDEAEAALSVGQWSRAQNALARAQRLAPAHPRVYLLWGDWHRQKQDGYLAAQMYKRAKSLAPEGSVFYRQAQARLLTLP